MKLRFQADNDLDQRIVLATRRLEPSIDFQTANDLGLHGLRDDQVLALAAGEGRVLVANGPSPPGYGTGAHVGGEHLDQLIGALSELISEYEKRAGAVI